MLDSLVSLFIMNKFQTLVQKFIGIKKESPQVAKNVAWTPRASFGMSEPASLDKQAQLQAFSYSWVYFSITKIAMNVANIRLKLLKQTGDKIERVQKHEVLDLLDKVNNVMTFYDLMELYSVFKESTGEAFWWLVRGDNGKIVEIYPWLRPDLMEVVPDPVTFVKGYIYNVPGTGTKVPFSTEEIIHFKSIDPLNPYRGLSPLKASEIAIATDREASTWNWRFFKNSARPDVAIEVPGTLTKDQYDRVMSQWDEAHKGTSNAHKFTIIEGGAKVVAPLGANQRDMDFLNQRKYGRDEILTVFGVPISLVIPESSNRSLAETAKAVFIEETIEPKMKKFVSTLNEFLLPFFDDTGELFFDYEDPTIGNMEQTLKLYESGIKNGWLSINEVRLAEGKEAVDGADSLYLPLNIQPIGTVKQKKSVGKINIARHKRTKGEKLEAIIKEELTIERLTQLSKQKEVKPKNKKSKKNVKFAFSEKQKDIYWKEYVSKTEVDEKLMVIELRKLFKAQAEKVLPTIKNIKTGFSFNVTSETKVFTKAFRPLLKILIAKYGNEVYDLLGFSGFIVGNDRIENFIKTDGLKFCKQVNETTKTKIKKTIAEGTTNGEGIRLIKNRVKDVFDEATDVRAGAIARTEVSRASNFATVEGYKQSGVVEKKEWVTGLDERVCPICGPLHGKRVDLNKDFGVGDAPPAHVNCRCVVIPVLKST